MKLFKPLADFIRFSAKVTDKIGRIIYTDVQSKRVKKWYADPKNAYYRTDFDLNPDSIAFDLGGFEGQWASDIYARFNCPVYVFEPVPKYAQNIKDRFKINQKIKVFPFGLSDKSFKTAIAIQGEGSSTLNKRDSSETIEIELVRFIDFIKEHNITFINVMKINIEGAEYDLLDDIINNGYIKNINHLIIQFHDFFPDAKQRMAAIRFKLKQTHDNTFYHEFVWEGWKLKL
ncbi:MAG TPA: FkbM family methyltransferase [Bacteroidia bacterium]|nr:FkbM family methyltransferase [Bacteroidia bacterium]